MLARPQALVGQRCGDLAQGELIDRLTDQ